MISKEYKISPELLESFHSNISSYKYDQYLNYTSNKKNSWEAFLDYRLNVSLKSDDVFLFGDIFNGYAILLLVRIPNWDKEHFGFKIANISVLTPVIEEDYTNVLMKNIREAATFLRKENVKAATVRINGDDLKSIHCFEENGFRYYEDVIWPIHRCKNSDKPELNKVRLMTESDLDEVIRIASNYQYQRGHFHCDTRFNIDKVNSLYGKWVATAFKNGEPIVVVEYENRVAGYFVLKIDLELSKHFGFKYGRMKSLAIDSSIRGKGIGKEIFKGAINKLIEMGADYIDSGYSTKNHISAKIHTDLDFYSVYEEDTFHKWL